MPTRKVFFIYSHEFVSIAAAVGAQAQATILISKESAFECNYITLAIKQSDVLVADWGGLLTIEDNSPGRTLFSVPISWSAVGGDGQQPYPLNPARLYPANTTITITYTNNVATATEAQLCLHGNKLYGGDYA